MSCRSELIPRAEALRVVEEHHTRVLARLKERLAWLRQQGKAHDDGVSAWWKGASIAFENAANEIAAIPAIGTCATCATWRKRGGTDTAGLLEGLCCRTQRCELASHFCAAYKPREGAK